MKPVTLHIGGPNTFDAVLRQVYPRFDSFTFLGNTGELQGSRKNGLAVCIATRDGAAILDMAAAIRSELGAEAVEIEYAGRRYRPGDVGATAALRNALAGNVASA